MYEDLNQFIAECNDTAFLLEIIEDATQRIKLITEFGDK